MRDNKIIVWFRNDLRIEDNEALFRAAEKTARVVPVYCFDTRQFANTALDFPKTDAHRTRFLIESVRNLQEMLRAHNSDLIVRLGKPEKVIPNLVQIIGAKAVYASKAYTYEELQVEKELSTNLWRIGAETQFFDTATLLHPDDIPFPIHKLPDVFSKFRKQVEKKMTVRPLFPIPKNLKPPKIQPVDLPTLDSFSLDTPHADPRSVLPFIGGETQAKKRLQDYIWNQDLLKNYKETRNALVGADYSSKFSPWLANGCLSPRMIWQQVKKYEQERTENESTYWLIFELLWRDYFKYYAQKYGNKIFFLEGVRENTEIPEMYDDLRKFKKWINSETGIPFIDANMKEIKYTGFMSNRGRQNVASYLVKDLKINWTWGAMYFESLLLDYDVESNWGNWAYIAGVGNDPRENRYFNIIKQAHTYDPEGLYVKQWLPELEKIPPASVHEPYNLNEQELQEKYGIQLGRQYPRPLVQLPKSVKSKNK
ncbi:MAG: DASH family cryptochrome [Bernardetiaceae bacterium]|nr:DASH family cryptochrome [Bernardetiaceae bacterium]